MKAEDTELTLDEINDIPDWNSIDLDPIIKLQAEISFKAGERQGALKAIDHAVPEAMKAGRKEVVDWGLSNCGNPEHPLPWLPKHQCPMCWHNQKEEWGIK